MCFRHQSVTINTKVLSNLFSSTGVLFSLIYSANKYLLSSYSWPNTIVVSEDTARQEYLPLWVCISAEEMGVGRKDKNVKHLACSIVINDRGKKGSREGR